MKKSFPLVIFILLIMFFTCGCLHETIHDITANDTTPVPSASADKDTIDKPPHSIDAAPTPTHTRTPHTPQPTEPTSKYLLPYSDVCNITEDDLAGFGAWTTRLARNEIYARYGYTFNTPEIQRFFENTSWYEQNPECNSENPPALNDYELHNAEIIKKYERRFNANWRIRLSDMGYMYDLPLVYLDCWDWTKDCVTNDIADVSDGYWITCGIYEYMTITYDDYQCMLTGEIVKKPYGYVWLILSTIDDGFIGAQVECDDGNIYEVITPESGETVLLRTPLPKIYLVETKRLFIKKNAHIHCINEHFSNPDASPYIHMTIDDLLMNGGTYRPWPHFFAIIQGSNIIEMVEEYLP